MIQHGRFIDQEYRHVLCTTYCMCILWHCSLHSSSTWKKLLWISKGHAITLFQEFNMTGTIGHEYKILLWLQGQYFKGWRFKHLRDNKIKNSNKAQRFSREFVYLFHCVIYTRVQCSYVSRTDFLDKQILIVVTVELEANMAAFHSVPVELVFSCWNLHLLADFYVTQESFHTTHLVHWTLVYHTRLVSSTWHSIE